jgi:hypothetical protein
VSRSNTIETISLSQPANLSESSCTLLLRCVPTLCIKGSTWLRFVYSRSSSPDTFVTFSMRVLAVILTIVDRRAVSRFVWGWCCAVECYAAEQPPSASRFSDSVYTIASNVGISSGGLCLGLPSFFSTTDLPCRWQNIQSAMKHVPLASRPRRSQPDCRLSRSWPPKPSGHIHEAPRYGQVLRDA